MNDVATEYADKIDSIAKITHEANRAYCQTIGDNSQLPWEQAPDWQKESARKGVLFNIENPGAPPSASHESWLKEKEATGWKYGPVKDAEKKEHPCFVPYDQLPEVQKRKDALFKYTVLSLTGLAGVGGRKMVSSASDERTVNNANVMRHNYRVLSDQEKNLMVEVKDLGLHFHTLLGNIGQSREISLAKTKVEEAVMWAVKHITG